MFLYGRDINRVLINKIEQKIKNHPKLYSQYKSYTGKVDLESPESMLIDCFMKIKVLNKTESVKSNFKKSFKDKITVSL